MPRAALLSLHARVEGVEPSAWDHPSLIQLWGPRYQVYVVANDDFALFSLARLPENEKGRLRAEQMAERLHAHLRGRRMTDRELGRALGIGNELRYATTTGTIAIRWAGARAPRSGLSPLRRSARPTRGASSPGVTSTSSGLRPLRGSPAGLGSPSAPRPTRSRRWRSLLPVRSPLGDEWLLADDEPAMRATATAAAPARLLPSGDAYFLLWGADRSCWFRARISGNSSGRLASGRARSSSTARSAEPGDGRSTRFGSMPGRASRAKRVTPSRPRPAPSRFQASTGRSR